MRAQAREEPVERLHSVRRRMREVREPCSGPRLQVSGRRRAAELSRDIPARWPSRACPFERLVEPARVEAPIREMLLQDRQRIPPIANAERGGGQQLGCATRPGRVTPPETKARPRPATHQSIGTRREERVRNKANVALGRCGRVEQCRTRPERNKGNTQPPETRWTVDPRVIARWGLLATGHERLALLGNVDPHHLDPTHGGRVPLPRIGHRRLEHRQPDREFRRPGKPEDAKPPTAWIVIRPVLHRDATVPTVQRKPERVTRPVDAVCEPRVPRSVVHWRILPTRRAVPLGGHSRILAQATVSGVSVG